MDVDPGRKGSLVNVNVSPSTASNLEDTPEIRKYKKRFNSDVLCASLWGKFYFYNLCKIKCMSFYRCKSFDRNGQWLNVVG